MMPYPQGHRNLPQLFNLGLTFHPISSGRAFPMPVFVAAFTLIWT